MHEIVLHDTRKSLATRLRDRKYVGPYHWVPVKPGTGRSFYQDSNALECDRQSTFDLRLRTADQYLDSRFRRPTAYFTDLEGIDSIAPIVALLPHGRGYLAGWTMGEGMLASLAPEIHRTAKDAALAAHDQAERDAERMRGESEEVPQEEDDASADRELLQYDALKRHSARMEYILRELSNGGWLDPAPAALRREADALVFNWNGMD